MTEQVYNIADHVRLTAVTTDKFKMSRLSFSFIDSADRTESPKTALMLATLMRGSEKYPTVSDIKRRLDDLYGCSVSIRSHVDGERHVFKITCEMLGERFVPEGNNENIIDGTLDLIGDILLNPKRDTEGKIDVFYLESEKKIAIDAIKSKINDQRAYADEKCREMLYCDSSFGISVDGNEEIISSFTQDDIESRRKMLLESLPVECFYVGPEEGNTIKEKLKNFFSKLYSDIERNPKQIKYGYRAYCYDSCFSSREECMPVSQGRLSIGFMTDTVFGDENYYRSLIFNEVFGGGSTSKLFMNVREKKSLCYYCSSLYSPTSGAIIVNCGIKPENKEAAFDEVMNQLDLLYEGHVSENELSVAKESIFNSIHQIEDSTSAIEAYLFREIMAEKKIPIDEYVHGFEDVTLEDVKQYAKSVKLCTSYFLNGNLE